MTSIVSICNLALSNIGKDNIASLSEMSAEARACRQFYDVTRDMLLQAYPWRFAGKTVTLARVANDQAARWSYAYQRPTDCLKIRSMGGGGCFDAQGSLIYSGASPAVLSYTYRVEDPALFSPLFADALSWQLAVRLAMPLTRDPKMRADAWQVAQQMTGLAQMADANEVPETYGHDSELVEARTGMDSAACAGPVAAPAAPPPSAGPDLSTDTDYVAIWLEAQE